MGADKVAVIHIGVIDRQTGLHLRLELLHHVVFAGDLVHHLNAGDIGKGPRQHLALVFVGGNLLGDHADLHTAIRRGGANKPGHFRQLLGGRQVEG